MHRHISVVLQRPSTVYQQCLLLEEVPIWTKTSNMNVNASVGLVLKRPRHVFDFGILFWLHLSTLSIKVLVTQFILLSPDAILLAGRSALFFFFHLFLGLYECKPVYVS